MPRFAANLTMLFNEVEFLDRFAAAARAGFSAVEFLFPYQYGVDELSQRLRHNRLTQVLFNLPGGDWAAGERGIACHPERVGEFQDGLGNAIDYAKALGCTQVNGLAGIPPGKVEADAVHDTLVSNLRFAAEQLGRAGIGLVIEPINTREIPGFYLCHTRQALSIIAEVGSDNLGLQYDAYHMQVMEGDLARTIEANLGLIRHIQIADNPGRHQPGTGEINYPFIFDTLDRIGYDGWVGCEYVPSSSTTESLGWAAKYLSG